jgi:hypothetical protein
LDEYYYFKIKKDEEDEERKEKMKEDTKIGFFCIINFVTIINQGLFQYIISNSKQQTTIPNQFSTINSNLQTSNSAGKIPYAIKFYKCKGCLSEMIFPIYNFKDIASIKKI